MYKYIFGPVPSRRLGLSLGIDLIPHKYCSLNCVYCECGCTTDLTVQRKEYISHKAVIMELDHYLQNNPPPEYVTFSGSGEPTLNSRIGDVLRFVKQEYPDIRTALLTNGTLLTDEQVRKDICPVDLVLPSLDAASDSTFKKINRPHQTLTIENHIAGLEQFRKDYSNTLTLEVFILSGFNDNENELKLLKNAFDRIQPDMIQLNTLDRPGTESDIKACNREHLQQIIDYWGVENAKIIAAAPDRKKSKAYRTDIEAAILETISRRPCTSDDLVITLGLHLLEIKKYLDVLEKNNQIETIQQSRGIFYQVLNRHQ